MAVWLGLYILLWPTNELKEYQVASVTLLLVSCCSFPFDFITIYPRYLVHSFHLFLWEANDGSRYLSVHI